MRAKGRKPMSVTAKHSAANRATANAECKSCAHKAEDLSQLSKRATPRGFG